MMLRELRVASLEEIEKRVVIASGPIVLGHSCSLRLRPSVAPDEDQASRRTRSTAATRVEAAPVPWV
jgi:hypothetical protein